MSKSNGEEEAEELEQRSEFSGDSEYEASSSSAVTTGSSAQFSEELKKSQGILAPSTPSRISSPGQQYQENGQHMLGLLCVTVMLA